MWKTPKQQRNGALFPLARSARRLFSLPSLDPAKGGQVQTPPQHSSQHSGGLPPQETVVNYRQVCGCNGARQVPRGHCRELKTVSKGEAPCLKPLKKKKARHMCAYEQAGPERCATGVRGLQLPLRGVHRRRTAAAAHGGCRRAGHPRGTNKGSSGSSP